MKNSNAMKELKEMIELDGKENVDFTNFIEEDILYNKHELIFITKVGSHLYGMATEDSDLDIKGIFLPATKDLILQNKFDQYGCYSTNKDDNDSNSADDVDIELWSIHKFFELLEKGDTNAYDLLFALSNKNENLYITNIMQYIYENRDKLMGSKPIKKSFIGYSYGQYKRYEAKGFNFKTLKNVLRYFKKSGYDPNDRLKEHFHKLKGFNGVKFTSDNRDKYVKVNDYKKYPIGMRMKDFINAIQGWANEYGSRVKNAEGVDYKSISHAFRVLNMANIIANTGDCGFPFEQTDWLLDVKNGIFDYNKLVVHLEKSVNYTSELLENTEQIRTKPNAKFMRNVILDIYKDKGCEF